MNGVWKVFRRIACASVRDRFYQPRIVKGFSIIEVVVAASIVSVVFMSVMIYYGRALKVAEQTTRYIQSSFLLEETVEAIKGMRDEGWTANITPLANGTTYYLYWNGSLWIATTTKYQVENYYDRSLILSAVNRDALDNIATTGTNDLNTRKITATVLWVGRTGTTTRSLEAYVANLFE